MPKKEVVFHQYGINGPDVNIASAALDEACTIAKDRFRNVEPGISVRESMNRVSQEFFKPREFRNRKPQEIMEICEEVYSNSGIVKFVVDMMTDFINMGIQIYHPTDSKQRRYRKLWKKVKGKHVSERLTSSLLRKAATVVKRAYADLNLNDVKDLERGAGGTNPDTKYQRDPKIKRNRIPIQYTMLNPSTVEVMGGDLALFVGQVNYGLRIPESIIKVVKNPRTPEEKDLVAALPDYIKNPITQGRKLIPLDPEKVSVIHYRKDDWKQWSDPIIKAILKDLVLYEKMKDADNAALDGSIRNIRIWKLGLPEHKIQPGPGAFKKLREQLLAAGNGGSIDLIWDASLTLQETSTDIVKFLGSAKYEPVLQAIYAALGIPQSLTGGKSGEGMTNNSLSLKTLLERLQYVRDLLVEFWEGEFAVWQKAFGDRKPAQLKFDIMSFSDEASEKMLWLHLYDRYLVSTETIRERFGELHDIEARRVQRDMEAMENGTMPNKIGPFVDAAGHPDQLAKIALQQGTMSPTEAGSRRKPKANGDKSMMDYQMEQKKMDVKNQNKGQPGQGRPSGQKDQNKRKQRTPKVAATMVTARQIQRSVLDIITPAYLEKLDKKTLRNLSRAEARSLQDWAFNIMIGIKPGDSIDDEKVIAQLNSADSPCPNKLFNQLIVDNFTNRGIDPTYEDIKDMQIAAYLILNQEDENG